jgi:hypothetical protein
MKKMVGFIVAVMILFSSLAYAGGDQNCGSKGQGPTGDDGKGDVTQNQPPAD